MASIHHSHQRTPSAGHKFVLRPTGTRPHITKNHSSSKLASKNTSHAKRKSADVESLADDFDMAMSFHQFCTTCEKQIAVPNSAVLYCSESCRRRDGTIATFLGAPPSPPLLSEYEAFTKRPALSRRKLEHSFSAPYIPAVQHTGKPDMDPTEWKPDASSLSHGGAGASSSSTVPRRPSEAMLYLSQYYHSTDSLMSRSSRRSSKDKERKNVSDTVPGIATGAGGVKGFSLTPAGSNDTSPASSPVESTGASAMTSGTASSVASAHNEDAEKKADVAGMGFAKKKIEAREEVSGSLGLLLAASASA